MGIIDRAKERVFGGDEEEETIEDAGFDPEPEPLEEEIEPDSEPEPEPEEEEEEPTWDNAYSFADEALQERGFGGVKDACAKIMARRVKESPKFRDPIKSGAQTANMIAESSEKIEGITSSNKDPIEDAAEKIESANNLADAVDDFTNKEDQFLFEAQRLAREGLEVIKDKDFSGGGGGVSTSTTVSEEEI